MLHKHIDIRKFSVQHKQRVCFFYSYAKLSWAPQLSWDSRRMHAFYATMRQCSARQ